MYRALPLVVVRYLIEESWEQVKVGNVAYPEQATRECVSVQQPGHVLDVALVLALLSV